MIFHNSVQMLKLQQLDLYFITLQMQRQTELSILTGESIEQFLEEFAGEAEPSLESAFEKTNSLIRKPTPTSHKIRQLVRKEHNIELVFVIVSKQASFNTKKDTITQCLVADETASIFMNFYNGTGFQLQEGDILYASGVYASHYKEMLLLYQGSQSIIRRVDRDFMRFDVTRNMSQQSIENPMPAQFGKSASSN